MPRKRTLSAIEKANRSPSEKLRINQINRRKADRLVTCLQNAQKNVVLMPIS
ncbi:hypothetical protein F5878DRAFT_668173 [Lentinula raphanica]|uniref:Uncharacterized protein n=1 Tax=Lentinula raphanica TaxID=153919 RepID=A0AA38U8Y1_9AGAR|nr:hypothetical protein F5878DRAFT_668173 [Lentinula raphanica]